MAAEYNFHSFRDPTQEQAFLLLILVININATTITTSPPLYPSNFVQR